MATGTPGTNGVWQYGEDDSEATFSALLNKAASTTDTQIGLDRARLTTLEARKLSGFVPVVPSSVAQAGGSASYNANGTVTFTNVTSISLNSVFTSGFTSYRIIFNASAATNSSNNLNMRLRASGTDNTTSNYWQNGFHYNNTTFTTRSFSAQTNFSLSSFEASSGDRTQTSLDVHNPQLNRVTSWTDVSSGSIGGVGPIVMLAAGNHMQTTQFDGITFYPTSGSFSGVINVYGYVS